MIKMIMLTLLLPFSFTVSAETVKTHIQKPILKRQKHMPSDAIIQGDKIIVNFGKKGLRFDLPLRPDLVKRAGDKVQPLKLNPSDQSTQDFLDFYDSRPKLDPNEVSAFQRGRFLRAQQMVQNMVETDREFLKKRYEKHEERSQKILEDIHKAYEDYDSMSFDEKARVNEMRRRVLKGVARFLSSQFKAGMYQVGESSIDSLIDEANAKVDFTIPSLKEKWILKALEAFNVQLFHLGKRILQTNEFGWVMMGAPVFVVPKFGHMYIVNLHVGYNKDDEHIYIRVSTSHQKAKLVGGFTIGFLPSLFGFYAASVDTNEKVQTFDEVSTYNPPSIPAMGVAGDKYAQFSSLLPGIPVGGMFVPTTLPPYPLSEFMFFTTSGKLKIRALGSFAFKKLNFFAKNPQAAPQVIEKVVEMPEEKKKTLIQNVLSMATFWKSKKCELALTPLEKAIDIAE